MKKDWMPPEISSLGITETAGGVVWNDIVDGPSWQDDKGNWHNPIGDGQDPNCGCS